VKTECKDFRVLYSEDGTMELTLSLSPKVKSEVQELKDILSKGKKLSVEIKQFREHRSTFQCET
jgi:hypothetical protein